MAGEYRTDDLALATTLAIAGFPHRVVKITQRKVLWVFSPNGGDGHSEEDMDDLIADYEEWTARVEPKQFILKLREMRREMTDVLQGSPISPAA